MVFSWKTKFRNLTLFFSFLLCFPITLAFLTAISPNHFCEEYTIVNALSSGLIVIPPLLLNHQLCDLWPTLSPLWTSVSKGLLWMISRVLPGSQVLGFSDSGLQSLFLPLFTFFNVYLSQVQSRWISQICQSLEFTTQ